MGTVTRMEDNSTIRVGSRVYLKNAVCGEPGCVVGFDRGKAIVHWPDLPELGRDTRHSPDSLVIDTAFVVEQLSLDLDSLAA